MSWHWLMRHRLWNLVCETKRYLVIIFLLFVFVFWEPEDWSFQLRTVSWWNQDAIFTWKSLTLTNTRSEDDVSSKNVKQKFKNIKKNPKHKKTLFFFHAVYVFIFFLFFCFHRGRLKNWNVTTEKHMLILCSIFSNNLQPYTDVVNNSSNENST